MHRLVLAAIGLLATFSNPAMGEVRLPKIFTTNMVLQQELPITVWGWADRGEKITVTLAGKSASTEADADGKWRVDLPAMKADGRAQTLSVAGTNT
ncbi:MAG: sialate O-acetylesterase, partial [Planctomycetes bacterium]|nr:sialate O-acetylesterase [Planctomycetota bacterium]